MNKMNTMNFEKTQILTIYSGGFAVNKVIVSNMNNRLNNRTNNYAKNNGGINNYATNNRINGGINGVNGGINGINGVNRGINGGINGGINSGVKQIKGWVNNRNDEIENRTIYGINGTIENCGIEEGGKSIIYRDITTSVEPDTIIVVEKNRDTNTSDIVRHILHYNEVNENFIQRNYNKRVRVILEGNIEIEGVLISQINGGLVILVDGRPNIIRKYKQIEILEKEPELNRPWISFVLQNNSNDFSISYLMYNWNWNTIYTVLYDDINSIIRTFRGKASVTNNTDTSFNNVQVIFAAGDVNPPSGGNIAFASASYETANFSAKRSVSNQVSTSVSGDLQLYKTLGDNWCLERNRTTDIDIVYASDIPVDKIYTYLLTNYTDKSNMNYSIEFYNESDVGLGTALPSGSVQTYLTQSSDDLIGTYIGSSFINNIIPNELITLSLGRSIFVQGQHTVSIQRIPYSSSQSSSPVYSLLPPDQNPNDVFIVTSTFNAIFTNTLPNAIFMKALFPINQRPYYVISVSPDIQYSQNQNNLEFPIVLPPNSTYNFSLVIQTLE